MDPDSPVSRGERMFWAVWYYITGAVNRFLRPEPVNIVNNDQGSLQPSVHNEPVNSAHSESDPDRPGVSEDPPVTTASLLSLSRSVVVWELKKESPSGGSESKAPKEGETKREEEIGQTGNDNVGQPVCKVTKAKENQEVENSEGKQSESDEVKDEETLVDRKPKSENTKNIQVKDEMVRVEDVLEEAADGGIKLYLSDMSPADERNMHVEELQTTAADTEIEDINAVSRLVSENENSNNEVEKQTENQHSVYEEEDTYDKTGSGLSSASKFKITIGKISNVSADFGDEVVDKSESHEGGERTQDDQEKMSETTREIHMKEEMLESGDVTLCQMTDMSPADEHEEAKVQSDLLDIELQKSDVASQLALENEINNEVKKIVENQHLEREEHSVNDQGGTGLTSFNEGFEKVRKSPDVSEDAEHEYVMKSRSESDEIEGERESVSEAADNRTTYVKQEQEKDFVNKHVEHNEVQQRAEPQLHTAKEKEDVAKDHEVQTRTRDTDKVTDEKSHMTTEISVEGRPFVKDDEEGMLSSEEEDKNDTACGIPLGTLKSKGKTGQEISSRFENTLLGIYEGQELNSPTYEGTQKGVPEYNNKPGPDENTTQWFLGGRNYKEIDATLLPEEVEIEEPERLQNSVGDFSMVREHKEEEQGSTGEEQTRTLLEETEIFEPVERSGHSKTTWTVQSEEAIETDRAATDLQGRNKTVLVDSETDEGLGEIRNTTEDGQESTAAVAEVDSLVRFTDKTLKFLEFEGEMTQTSFSHESGVVTDSECESIKSPTLEDTAEVGVLKQSDETEPKLLGDTSVEMQAAGTGMEEKGYGDKAVDNEMQNKSEMESLSLDVALITKDSMLSAKRETSFGLDSQMEKEMQKNETEAEESCAERTRSSISGRQEFIDEEILDLWIEAAPLQDTNVAEETGQQMHVHGETLQTEERAKLFPLSPGKSGLMNDTETYLFAESGLLDLSICEWERDLRHSSGTFQSPHDTVFAELFYNETQEATDKGQSDMTEEESIAQTRFHHDSGFHSSDAGYLRQGSNQCQEKMGQEGDIRSSVQTEEVKEMLEELISGESELLSATEMYSSTTESGLLNHSVSEWGTVHRDTSTFPGPNDNLETEMSTQEPYFESQDPIERGQSPMTEDKRAEMGYHPDSRIGASEAGHQESDQSQLRQGEEGDESAVSETGSQKEIGTDITSVAIRTDEEKTIGEELLDHPRSRSGSDASFQDEPMLDSQEHTGSESEERLMFSVRDKSQANTLAEDTDDTFPETAVPATHSDFLIEMNVTVLDFTAQRSRIAVKNRHVRPPQNPRSLLNMPSELPTPATHLPVTAPTGIPFRGMGIGIKLPGLGSGFPVLKKTCVVADDKSSEEPEAKPEKSDSPKAEEAQHKPKWMPPTHHGFGNPLMSELKTKLRKATKE